MGSTIFTDLDIVDAGPLDVFRKQASVFSFVPEHEFAHGGMENSGLNDPDREQFATDFARQKVEAIQAARRAELAVVEFKDAINSAVTRFGSGVGTDVIAPEKASFRKASHHQDRTWG